MLCSGKWEATSTLPELDACGGHFGYTPESPSTLVYHYHVQASPPFTFGCFGPATNSDGHQTLVTLDACRALYTGCGDTSSRLSLTTSAGTVQYDPWCPCYDADASNVGTAVLKPWQTDSSAVTTCSTCTSTGTVTNAGTNVNNANGLSFLLLVASMVWALV